MYTCGWVPVQSCLVVKVTRINLNLSSERCIMVIKRHFYRFQVHMCETTAAPVSKGVCIMSDNVLAGWSVLMEQPRLRLGHSVRTDRQLVHYPIHSKLLSRRAEGLNDPQTIIKLSLINAINQDRQGVVVGVRERRPGKHFFTGFTFASFTLASSPAQSKCLPQFDSQIFEDVQAFSISNFSTIKFFTMVFNPLRANYCRTWHMENHPRLCFVLYLIPCTYFAFVWQPTHFLEADKICELLTRRHEHSKRKCWPNGHSEAQPHPHRWNHSDRHPRCRCLRSLLAHRQYRGYRRCCHSRPLSYRWRATGRYWQHWCPKSPQTS